MRGLYFCWGRRINQHIWVGIYPNGREGESSQRHIWACTLRGWAGNLAELLAQTLWFGGWKNWQSCTDARFGWVHGKTRGLHAQALLWGAWEKSKSCMHWPFGSVGGFLHICLGGGQHPAHPCGGLCPTLPTNTRCNRPWTNRPIAVAAHDRGW